jgi:hypothetical protein
MTDHDDIDELELAAVKALLYFFCHTPVPAFLPIDTSEDISF